MLRAFLILALAFALPAHAEDPTPAPWLAPPGTYRLNTDTVEVTMTARRFLMPPIHAEFGTVEGELVVSENAPSLSSLAVDIAAADLSANGPMVERLLTGEDFLNVEAHPRIVFVASDFTVSDVPSSLTGNLEMAGIAHEARFDIHLTGFAIDPETNQLRLRFVTQGTLTRSDWGMTGYRGIVSEETQIRIEAEFVREADSVPTGLVAN